MVIELGGYLKERPLLDVRGNRIRYIAIMIENEFYSDLGDFVHGKLTRRNYGPVDRVWSSPHYADSYQYLRGIFHAPVRQLPFLWQPRPSLESIIKTPGDFERAALDGQRNIVIVATNREIQKSALIPLVVVNELWRQNPDAFDRVTVVSSHRSLGDEGEFWRQLKTTLQVHHGRRYLKSYMSARAPFEAMFARPAVLLEHQENWGLNYLTLVAFYTGIPVVHNSPFFVEAGYYYYKHNVTDAVEQLERALGEFTARRELETVVQFSPTNPVLRAAYSDLIEEAITGDAVDEDHGGALVVSARQQTSDLRRAGQTSDRHFEPLPKVDAAAVPPVSGQKWPTEPAEPPVPTRWRIGLTVNFVDNSSYLSRQNVNGFTQNVKVPCLPSWQASKSLADVRTRAVLCRAPRVQQGVQRDAVGPAPDPIACVRVHAPLSHQ